MRILQILHDRERGGVRTLARTIEAGLTPHRFAFETAYMFPRPGLPAWSKLRYALRMARRIWRGDFDVLIAYQTTASILVGTIGWLAGCRLRIVHQTCMPRETALPIRMLDMFAGTLGLYTVNIANTAATWSEFGRYPEFYRRSMMLIEYGLDAPAPTHMRQEARRRFNLPLEQPILLNVARLAAQKNQEQLIRVLACMPEVHLVLAGSGDKDASLRALAATLGVTDRIHLLGALPVGDIADLYSGADLFVFPSTWETFGLAAVEAAMVGVPMVVADLPGLREVLQVDGSEPVEYVAPHDTEGWIAAIRAALAAPPLPRTVATYARAMRRKYSRERMIDSYLSFFEVQPSRKEQRRAGLQEAATEDVHS
jgi:glycosyltransferase involved in cell wall biosynthesis